MSIYNGFATRQQETVYLKCIYYMFVILQSKVASSITGTHFDEFRFEEKFEKLYNKIRVMDKNKYLHPRFSMCFGELADALGLKSKHVKPRKHAQHSTGRKDNRSCSEFVDNLSSEMNTHIGEIADHNEFEEAGHGVIQNFRKFIKDEDYSKPLSDKRIALIKLSPDEIKNEIKELSARKKIKNKRSNERKLLTNIDYKTKVEKKYDTSKRIIFSGEAPDQFVTKKLRNRSSNSHNIKTVESDLSLQYNHPMYVNNPDDEKHQSSKKHKKRKNRTTKLIQQIPEIEIDVVETNQPTKDEDPEIEAIIYTDNINENNFAEIPNKESKGHKVTLHPIKHTNENKGDNQSIKQYYHRKSVDNSDTNENTPPNQNVNTQNENSHLI